MGNAPRKGHEDRGGDGQEAFGGDVETVLTELRTLEQRISSIHAVQRHELEAVTHQLGQVASQKNASQGGHVEGQETLVFLGTHFKVGAPRIVTGPVVGRVTDRTAKVLIEVDSATAIGAHICVVDDECPGGRLVASQEQEAPANRPIVFKFEELTPGAKYQVVFSNVDRRDMLQRVAKVQTMSSASDSGRSPRVVGVFGNAPGFPVNCSPRARQSVWKAVGKRIDRAQVDVVLHIGGQVDLRGKFKKLAVLLERARHRGADELARAEELVEDDIRDAYRINWNRPEVRSVLASCSNLMMWSDLDMPTLPSRNTLEAYDEVCVFREARRNRDTSIGDTAAFHYPPALLTIAQRVFREYQRSLWDDQVTSKPIVWGAQGAGNEETYCIRLTPQVGVLFVDSRGSQFNPDGTPTPWPLSPILSDQQWLNIRTMLNDCKAVDHLIVVSDRPIVPHSMPSEHIENQYDEWSVNNKEQTKLLSILFNWKSEAQVWLLSGSGPGDFASESVLSVPETASSSGVQESEGSFARVIRQVALPPITRCFEAAQRERTVPAGPLHGILECPSDLLGEDQAIAMRTVAWKHLRTVPPGQALAAFAAFDKDGDAVTLRLQQAELDQVPAAAVVLGPLIGKVTHDSAIVVVEVSSSCALSCQLVDQLTGKVAAKLEELEVPAGNPWQFSFRGCLRPDSRYEVFIHGAATDSRGSNATVHTMPSPHQIELGAEHRVVFFAVFGDRPQELLGEQASLWSEADQLRRRLEPSIPAGVLHLGGQVSLDMIEDELRTHVRVQADGLRPGDMESAALAVLRSGIEALVRGLYRTTWNLPHVQDMLASSCNLMVISQEDIKAPRTFALCPDLVPWIPVVQELAYKVASEFQAMLHGGEGGEPESFHVLGGGAGVLILNFAGIRVARRRMLTTKQWRRVDQAVQTDAQDLKTLIVAMDRPLVDDAPTDALHKAAADPSVTEGWPFHRDECVRLIDLLFAWKAQLPGRDVMVVCGSASVSFESMITHQLMEPRMSISQTCVGPISGAVNVHESELPFALTGTVDQVAMSTESSQEIQNPHYEFKHRPSLLGQNGFGILYLGCASRSGSCRVGVELVGEGLVQRKSTDSFDQLTAVPFAAWLFALVVMGERIKVDKPAEAKRREEARIAAQARNQAEQDLKTAYPDLAFPEDQRRFAEDDSKGDHEEAKEEEASEPKAKRKTKASLIADATKETLDFKWLDVDFSCYGPDALKRLQDWKRIVAEEESEYVSSVHACFSRFAIGDGQGVRLPDVFRLVVDCFTKELPQDVVKPVSLADLVQQEAEVARMATAVVVQRRVNALESAADHDKPIPFADVLPLCSSVGAVLIMARTSLERG
ncbi:Hypothetical protein SCF082_LOCUS5653 [Durusdinium trenchii]|uniref:Uncharacterized protein n=1 Tax=Durusdinium trenchii TaxID=1381693 RepID=A0ABP0I786_9DINO